MLKSVFHSALYVVAGTVATTVLVACFSMFTGGGVSSLGDLPTAIGMTIILGAVAGLVASVFSLPIAVITMPPVIGLARVFKLPRPFVDVAGGALAALPCVLIMIGLMDDTYRSKGAEPTSQDMRIMLKAIALFGGGALGYVRYTFLVKPRPRFVRT